MRIGLINYYLRTKEYPTRYSLSVLRIAEYLNSLKYNVEILPISLSCNEDDIVNFIKNNIKNQFDIIGISHYVWSTKMTQYISNKIRELTPEVNTIIGGPEVRYIDFKDYENELFILGEGEQSLANSINYIVNHKKDLNFFDENSNVFDRYHPNASINEIPINYINPLFTKFKNIDKDFLYYETSRGCCYKCGYCGFRNRENISNFDLEFIREEIKRIGELQFKEVFVIDANFGGTPDRAKKIMNFFNEYASNAVLTIYLRPEFIDDEMIEILKNSNLKEIRIGIQTTNKNVPDWIRTNSLYHIMEELPKLASNNINWKAELIIGLPGDDMIGFKKSIDFVEKNLKPSEYCCYPLTLIKDTPLYELLNNFDKNNNLWITMDSESRAYSSSSYTHEDLIAMHNYAIMRMNQYLNKNNHFNEKKIQKKLLNKVIYKDIY